MNDRPAQRARRMQPLLVIGVLLSLPACAVFQFSGTAEVPTGYDEPTPAARYLLIERAQLEDTGGPLLEAISRAQPQIKTEHTSTCPRVVLRGPMVLRGFNDPDVYVDGTRAGDTCILDHLPAEDVERVEIYPTGVTPRPGYATSPHGLILVFLRRS